MKKDLLSFLISFNLFTGIEPDVAPLLSVSEAVACQPIPLYRYSSPIHLPTYEVWNKSLPEVTWKFLTFPVVSKLVLKLSSSDRRYWPGYMTSLDFNELAEMFETYYFGGQDVSKRSNAFTVGNI